MDNSLFVSLIIATIAIIPGIVAMIYSAKKDKLLELNMTAGHFHKINSDRINELEKHIQKNETINTIDDLWKMMYEKPVIVRCKYCNSPNVITNLDCMKCGAPLDIK